MVEGKTISGFEYSIDSKVLKDWDFLELIDNFQNGDTSLRSVKNLLVMLLTEDGFLRLKEHVKALNDGIANAEGIMKEFTEICNNPELKNSEASHIS